MRFLITILFVFFTIIVNAQMIKGPDASSNYRLLGDTTKHYNGVVFEEWKDSITNEQYMKAFDEYVIKEWIRYYGFTKIWWIEPNTQTWTSRWMLDHYWKYTPHTIKIERIELDSTLQPIRRPIK